MILYGTLNEPFRNPTLLKAQLSVSLELRYGRFQLNRPVNGTEAVPLPKLDGQRVEEMARLLRLYWQSHQLSAIWYLYLDLASHAWRTYVEPAIRMTESRLLATVCRNDLHRRRVQADLVLAGCFFSSPVTDRGLLERTLPKIDGLFLIWHPTGWLNVTVMIRARGEAHFLELRQVLSDLPDDEVAANWVIGPGY